MSRRKTQVVPLVVLVDDDVGMREALTLVLRFEGFEVSAHGTGKSLASFIASGPRPSVVVLDLALPDMSGGRCLQMIRGSKWGDVPVLILSGWGQLERFAAGAQGHLQKGCDVESVVRTVARLARLPVPAPHEAGPRPGPGASEVVKNGPRVKGTRSVP